MKNVTGTRSLIGKTAGSLLLAVGLGSTLAGCASFAGEDAGELSAIEMPVDKGTGQG